LRNWAFRPAPIIPHEAVTVDGSPNEVPEIIVIDLLIQAKRSSVLEVDLKLREALEAKSQDAVLLHYVLPRETT
jgi:hypothetical protein